LIFLLLDDSDKDKDLQLARHIGSVHKYKKAVSESGLFNQNFLRAYVSLSKSFNPVISG
jgi:DNA replicative helicase MCM subunit Mcm2 (Cdc46/Mcm family)